MDASVETTARGMTLQYREKREDSETVRRNRQAILDMLDAADAGSSDALWNIMDPDVTFHEAACLPYGGAHRGLEATRRGYARLSETFSELKTVIEAVLAERDMVIVYQTITFRARASGNSGTLPVAELFRFRGGKVIEWRALYFDADLVATAIFGGTRVSPA
jgi:ketosteroid isomerase-like protein